MSEQETTEEEWIAMGKLLDPTMAAKSIVSAVNDISILLTALRAIRDMPNKPRALAKCKLIAQEAIEQCAGKDPPAPEVK